MGSPAGAHFFCSGRRTVGFEDRALQGPGSSNRPFAARKAGSPARRGRATYASPITMVRIVGLALSAGRAMETNEWTS